MTSEKLKKNITKHFIKQRIKIALAIGGIILVIALFVLETTFTFTGEIYQGEILDTYVSPSNRRIRPGEANMLARVKMENGKELNIKVPIKYINQVNKVFNFKEYESLFLSRKQYRIENH